MIIIKHDTHDYYDSMISKFGYSKEGNTFDRKSYNVDTKSYDFLIQNFPEVPRFLYWDNDNKNRFDVEFFNIVFCGKLYGGIRFFEDSFYTPSSERINHVVYTYEQLVHFLEQQNIEFVTNKIQKCRQGRAFIKLSSHDYCKEFFEVKDQTIKCAEHKIVTAVIRGSKHRNWTNIEVNPCLKDYQFFKMFDSYTCYQELAMFVDGHLAYPGNIMVEIEDKYRIAAHGFDTKYGFRTRPNQ
jgi:hypothetical protein